MIRAEDFLWFPFLRYLDECEKSNKEASINEFLISRNQLYVWEKPEGEIAK